MSTILTICLKDPETRVIFSQPLYSISEIQLVDYDFPDIYITFGKPQTIKKLGGSSTLLSLSKGGYSLSMLITAINLSDSGCEVKQMWNDYYRLFVGKDGITFSEELRESLGLPSILMPGKYFPISWPSHKYHLYCDIGVGKSNLGRISTEGKLFPTNLLAIIPSKNGEYPSIQIERYHLINYIHLSLLNKDGVKPNFSGVPFRINLKIIH